MNVMKYHIIMWKIGAVWPISQTNKLINRIYFIIYHTIFSFTFNLFFIMKLFTANDLNDVIEILPPFSTLLMFAIKSLFVVKNRRKILKLFAIIDELESTIIPTQKSREKIQHSVWQSKRLIGLISCCYYFGTTSFFVLALWSNERVLVWNSWIPFGFDYRHCSSLQYYIILIYQYLCTLIPAIVATSIDTYGSNLNNLLATYFDILSMQLMYIGHIGIIHGRGDVVAVIDNNDDDCRKSFVAAADGGKLQYNNYYNNERQQHQRHEVTDGDGVVVVKQQKDKQLDMIGNEIILTECVKCHICCIKYYIFPSIIWYISFPFTYIILYVCLQAISHFK